MAMGRLSSKTAYHFTVDCSVCGATAEVCPRKGPPDALMRAGSAFRTAGWHLDASHTVKPCETHSDFEYGVGSWYCAACASKRP
jgi:hypothetical protein